MRLISLRRARANTKVYAGALLIAGNLALAACKNPPPAFPPPEVTVASVVQRDVSDFDEFTGQGIPEGSRSLAWALTFRDRERTLKDNEVQGRTEKIVKALEGELGVRQRTS